MQPTEAFYQACNDLINWKGGFYKLTKFYRNEELIEHASYVGGDCLCALGVIAKSAIREYERKRWAFNVKFNAKETKQYPTFQCNVRESKAVTSALFGVPVTLFAGAERLFEGWRYNKEKGTYFPDCVDRERAATRWTHKQVGVWLEKVGRAIENRPNRIKQIEARRCEFNLGPVKKHSRLTALADFPSSLKEAFDKADEERAKAVSENFAKLLK